MKSFLSMLNNFKKNTQTGGIILYLEGIICYGPMGGSWQKSLGPTTKKDTLHLEKAPKKKRSPFSKCTVSQMG